MQLPNWTDPAPDISTRLGDGNIHVWRFDLGKPIDNEFVSILSNNERTHLETLKHGNTAKQYFNTRYHVRHILGLYLNMPASALKFTIAPGGKPQLLEANLHFNLSHSHDLGLLAISNTTAVGVDIEKIRPNKQLHKIARRLFPRGICEQLAHGNRKEQQASFFHEWTAMEARQKCQGRGIFKTPVAPQDVHCQHFIPEKNYIAAVAVERTSRLPMLQLLNSQTSMYDAFAQ